MPSRSITIATLRSYVQRGYGLTAFCSNYGKCSHSGQVRLDALIQRLGWDFDAVQGRGKIIAILYCSKCGKRHPEIRLSLIDKSPGSYATGFAEPVSVEEATRRELEFRQAFRERIRGTFWEKYERNR